MERMVRMPPKPHEDMKAGKRAQPASEFTELSKLLAQFPDAAIDINRRLDEGAPFLRLNVDSRGAPGALRHVATGIELAEWLKERLAAMRRGSYRGSGRGFGGRGAGTEGGRRT